jgi:ferric-dicitrate binding protein FerR (iron transport regulator)
VLVDTEIVVMYCVTTGRVRVEVETKVSVRVTAGGTAVVVESCIDTDVAVKVCAGRVRVDNSSQALESAETQTVAWHSSQFISVQRAGSVLTCRGSLRKN